ncbi:MAG: hypothetical protein JOZ47_22725 [Kutzneria sp.]|nr:hypothetical protein [Kutzneria sp.]MBV9847858.1 hypothetical protein [Kutzneria sp.]
MTGDDGEPGAASQGATVRRPPRRKKVILAEAKGQRGLARTIVELEEQTSVGEHLVRTLVRAQLRTALMMTMLVVAGMTSLPMLFYLLPAFADFSVFGVRLSWVLLVLVPYPLMYGVGAWYVRRADRHEQDFVNMVDR